jgi:hypothetical protein
VVSVGITREDLQEQERLQLTVGDELSRARRAAEQLEAALEQLAEGDAGAPLEELQAELVTAEERYSQPMLIDQLLYLYRNLGRADQPPGRDAVERHAELSARLETFLARLQAALPASGGPAGS